MLALALHLQLAQSYQYSQDALASLYASGDAAGAAAAAASAGWGLAPHFMPPASAAHRPPTPSPLAPGGRPQPAPGTPRGGSSSGGDGSDGGPAFAFGQLTSTLPEPLTFGGSPSDGRQTPARVASPSRAKSPARGGAAGSPARAGHPHKRAREDDAAGFPPAAPVPRPGFGGSSLPAQPPRAGRATARQQQPGSGGGQQHGLAAALREAAAGGEAPPALPPRAAVIPDAEGRHCVVEDTSEVCSYLVLIFPQLHIGSATPAPDIPKQTFLTYPRGGRLVKESRGNLDADASPLT